MKARIGKERSDGKRKVSFFFEGGPNGFGGITAGKKINKVMTLEAIRKSMEKYPDAYGETEKEYFLSSIGY